MKQIFTKLCKDNNGVSLLEMVVVIAIMSVLVGMVSLGFGMVSTKSATQCASNIEISLNRNRISTMGKQGGYIAFYMDSDGDIRAFERFGESPADLTTEEMSAFIGTKIGKKGLEVKCGDIVLTNASNTPVYYRFSRSDGSLSSGGDKLPISVKKGSKTYMISINSLTGKVSMSQS